MNNALEKLIGLECKATGIGSVPHADTDKICKIIMDKFCDIPFCPQIPKADPRENMMLQFGENLPMLKADLQKKELCFDASADKDEELLKFYEQIADNNFDYFKISLEYMRGFYKILELSKDRPNQFIKSQVIGPITLLSSIMGPGGKALLHDEALSDALVRALAMKGVWQAKQIRSIGKEPIIFFDEPALSSFGSAFMPLSGEKAVSIINNIVDWTKEQVGALIGVHCCGNTDWEMLLSTKIDILNFDSYGFGKYFILYADAIKKFLERGGVIAWGAVPTSEFNEAVSLDSLRKGHNELLDSIVKKGVDRNTILEQSLFSPSCGMGLLDESLAEIIVEFTRLMSVK